MWFAHDRAPSDHLPTQWLAFDVLPDLVILLTMTVLPLGDVKSHLSELVGRVHDYHERVTVTVHGRPSAVLIAPEDLERLEETLEIMRDAATMSRAGRVGRGTGSRRARLRRGTRRGDEAAPGAVSREPAEESYELRATSTVRRALSENLPEAVAAAAYEFITGPLLLDPHRIGKRLLPPMDDRFSARRGTYRVIYRIDDKARVVTVVDIAHRRDVYRT